MLRQASSRNQRAKGFKSKHALQIGILVAICIWLVYQVKHSHEKKSAYDARNSKLINKVTENQEDFFKFGRKDLRNEAGTVNEIPKEDETEEVQEEGEPEVKQEEPEDEEARGAGDDKIDDQDQENTEEAEHGEDSAEEDDKDVQIEEKDLFDNPDHEEDTQAAREENYKRDDASSAVVHVAHATESETVNGDAKSTNEEQIVEHSKVDNDSLTDGSKVDGADENLENDSPKVDGAGENLEKKETGAENVSSEVNVSDLLVKDNGTKTDDSRAKNGTAAESKESDAETSKADNGLISNSTTVEAENQIELLTNTTIASTESNIQVELLPANSTSVSGNQTEGQNNSTLNELDRQVEVSNSTMSSDSARDGNATDEKGTSMEVESNVVDPAGKSNSIVTLDLKEHEHSTSSATENGDAMEKEERDNPTDLSTLSHIQNEAKSMDKEAAE